MKALFHHASDVIVEENMLHPLRFTPAQIAALQQLNPGFGDNARRVTGISLCFETEQQELSFSYRTSICHTLSSGFDVYENGVMYDHIPVHTVDGDGEFRYTKKHVGKTRMEIYLPATVDIRIWDIQFGEYQVVEPAKPLVLFYGDSLTSSVYRPNPSFTFVSLWSRLGDFDYVNRGVGSLFFEESWLDEADALKPQHIVVEYGPNDLVKHDEKGQVVWQDGKAVFCAEEDIPALMNKAEGFLKKLEKIYPEAKLHVISRIYSAVEMEQSRHDTQMAYNRALTALCQKLELPCIDGETLIPHIPECRVEDREHFSEIGSAMVAMSLAKQIQFH